MLLAATTILSARHQSLVIIGLLIAQPFVRYMTLNAYHGEITHEQIIKSIQLPFHTHADGLLAGLLLSWLSILKPEHLTPLPLFRNLVWPTILVIGGFILRTLNQHLFAFSALAMIFGGATLFMLRDRSALSKPGHKYIFYLTSRLSYGMYLNHFPIISFGVPLLLAAKVSNRPYVNFFIGYPIMVFGSMVVAAGTFILIESPFLQLRDRWLAAKKPTKMIEGAGLKTGLNP